jgi:catechol 2,3-dioxygenase-like lactoylglutathione lyase family enzyme
MDLGVSAMTAKFGHINIVVRDLDAAKEFFVTNFGFTAGAAVTLEGPWVDALNALHNVQAVHVPLSLQGSTVQIELLKFLHPIAAPGGNLGTPNKFGYRHVDFDVDNIDELTSRLQSQGWEFLSAVQTVSSMNLKTVYFLGPEGVLIQMTETL